MAEDVTAPPLNTFRFDVAVVVGNAADLGLSSPLCSAAFAECSGIEASMSPKSIEEGGNNREQIHLLGRVSYGQLTLKRGMTSNLDLWKWFAAVTSRRGRGDARAVTEVTMKEADGSRALTFKLTGCVPVKLKAPSLAAREGGIAIEEMTIAYSKFELRPA